MKPLRGVSRKYYVRQVIACWMMCFMLLWMVPTRIAMADPNPAPGTLPSGLTGAVGLDTPSIVGNDMIINQTAAQAIGNWHNFDIGAGASVTFVQPSSSSAVLNRVTGPGMTGIWGAINANGQVWIVNPAGVLFGSSATINVNRLVASGLNITNDNFLNGKYEFAGGNGSVINQGNISADSVYLVGKEVINAGNIQCPDGYVVMAAADKVYLGRPGGNIIVEIGTLIPNGEQARVINQGTVDAGGGTIILAAAGDALARPIISNMGLLSTSATEGNAGNISLQANNGQISNTGEIAAISETGIGGIITANADEVINSGTMNVSGAQGGTVDLQATSSLDQAGNIHANGSTSDGGKVNLTAGTEVILGSGSLTTANAGTNGNGGDIIAYSPKLAFFEENALIEARGGAMSGNGGFVELSGLEGAMVGGFADLRAPAGAAGTFFLDPHNVTISNLDNSLYNVNVNWLESQLGLGNWTVNTTLGSGEGDITVVDPVGLGGAWMANNLTLDAYDDIFINAQIINSGTGDLYLIANNDITINAPVNLNSGYFEALAGRYFGASTLGINAGITAGSMLLEAGDPAIYNVGSVNIQGADVPLTTTNGDLEIYAREDIILQGDLDAQGNIHLFSDHDMLGSGDVETSGTLNATGNVTIVGRNVTTNESVEAGENILIKGMEFGGTVETKDTLTTTNGDIDIMVVATDWAGEGYVENGYLEDGLIKLGGDVVANGTNSDLTIYNNTEVTADIMTMQAGRDVILTEQCQTLTGKSKLTIDALGGQINHGGAAISVTDSELALKQFDDLDAAGFNIGNKESTDVTLQSYGGYVKDLAADEWASISTTADNGNNNSGYAIELAGNDDITAKELYAYNDSIKITTIEGGDVIVDNAETPDKIVIDSAGAIREYDNDPEADLIASELDLDAASGIFGSSPIETSATLIAADTINGDIDIDNTTDDDATATSLTTGNGNILFSQKGNGSLTVNTATTDDGDINIDVEQSDLVVDGTLTAGGSGKVTLEAPEGQMSGGVITSDGGMITMKQKESLNLASFTFGNQSNTDIDLESYKGSVTADQTKNSNAADQWNSVTATAYNGINLEGAGNITTKELTTITNNIYVHTTGGNLIVNGDITADPIPDDELGGGVSLIADEGKIYTEGGSDDTINVNITGYSDASENIGVELPKHYGDETEKLFAFQSDSIEIPFEHEVGRAAIVIMSEETLKLGSEAELTANGIYDSEGIVDDRPGVDFLDVVEGAKNPGEPIDVAIYLASNAGNVVLDCTTYIEPFGVMVVDAYDTVEPFGADFIDSLDEIDRLEVCSRRSTTLAFAQMYDTLPYADNKAMFPGPGQYFLRGETTDVGTGAWELRENPLVDEPQTPQLPLREIVQASNVDPPSTPEIENAGQMIGNRSFDDIQWMANELGLCDGDQKGEDENLCQEISQAYLAGAFLQSTDLRPYRAATRLRDLVEILHDDDGTRIAGLVRTVNEFSQPDMPPSPEQFALIAQSFTDHNNDGTHYAAAGEWLDAMMEYVAILNTDIGWSEDESIAFVMGKYGTSITEAGDVSVAAFVQMHLEGYGA